MWGGRGPDAFDCSGLIIWSYKQAVPDITFRIGKEKVTDINMNDMWTYNTMPILPENMAPGDIVFVTNKPGQVTHGGMFIAWIDEYSFKMVNASSYYDSVVVDTWPLEGEVRDQWFVAAGRLLRVVD